MSFNLESGKSKEINETPEVKVDSEQLSETEETAENFDDCSLNEVQDSKGNEVNAESLEDAEENYDDCAAKIKEMEEENPELAEEDDDFGDCGKETDGQYVAEVTYTTDGEISREEARAELQEAYNECADPEDMQQLKENANENEHIEVHNAEVVERPENSELGEEVTAEEYEEAQAELEEARETLEAQQEAAQEYQEDLENRITKYENNVSEETENINNEVSEKAEDSTESEEATKETEDSSEIEEATEETENSAEAEETTEETSTSEGKEIEAEDLEEMDDASKVEASEINEDTLNEDISEDVEENTNNELSDEAKEQVSEEVSDEINSKAENDKISVAEAEEIVEEKKDETVNSLEDQSESMDNEIEQKAEQIAENDELTDEKAKEQISEEIAELDNEELSDEDVEAMVEGKSEAIEETVEEKTEEQEAVDAVEETADALEEEKTEQFSEQTEQSLQKRIDDAFEKEDVTASEINNLRDEYAAELQAKIEEKNSTEVELKSKFDEVLSKEKGSDEYRQSLQEYNALQDKKSELTDQIATMEKQQDLLDKKSIELREAQIQKGSEAIAASAATLAGVNMLQERYDQTYYDTKADKSELANIRDESSSAIKELSAEKDSIKQAMDAKMDEISEYVISNNMDRYDTAHDLRYQQMSAEYNAMKESYDRIGYSIVKLDENNKAITEQLGDKYVSMVELPPSSRISEVNDGTDVPGETNYFIDEIKASEVLSPFKPDNWEQLTIQEQKQAVEKLADYNAEILGVEDKPRIIYYNAKDPCDFGGYSAKQNAIYINEYSMHDATETADTISHEYRHKYQHERAEKLETERDLEFKEGFDNYIRAEDDYQGYKEQLVEADARAYAQIVKDKVSSYSENSSENTKLNGDQRAFGTEYTKLNPEKGAVFEKVSVDELPEDFEQKDRIKYKEVLEAKELDELREVASVHYENGKSVWGKLGIQELESYKEHNDIVSGHIENVRVKSLEAADALEVHFRQNNYDGLYSSNIDRKTVEVMSIYHDTGMDGNIKAEDYASERVAYTANKANRDKFIAETLSKKERDAKKNGEVFDKTVEEKQANEKFEAEGFETHFRPNHSLESSIHALRDRDSIDKLGISADEVALGCLVHSKSNSGLENIASEQDWERAINRLQTRVDEFNRTHPEEPIHFNSSFLLNDDGSFNQEKLAEMRSEAIVLRIGDANGHDTNSRTAQNGKPIEFTLVEKDVEDKILNEAECKFKTGNYKEYFREVQTADVKVGGIELNNTNDPQGVSRMFAVGEGNFKSLSCEIDNSGSIIQNFELCDGNAFPLSTQNCIIERIEEYATAKPLKYTPVVKLGNNCSNEVYKSYLAFADRIYRDYKVRMKVVR